MNCPKCKQYELLPARTREDNPAVDGLKCPHCANLYRLNSSNHMELIGAPKLTDADLKPGITREDFITVLKTTTRPIEKPLPKPKEAQPSKQKRKFTEADKAAIRAKVAAGFTPSRICEELNCKPWAVYYYGSGIPKPSSALKRDSSPSMSRRRPPTVWPTEEKFDITDDKLREAIELHEKYPKHDTKVFTLVIRMAENGFIVTNADDGVYIYRLVYDLTEYVKTWAMSRKELK